jgi:hypothetical protein
MTVSLDPPSQENTLANLLQRTSGGPYDKRCWTSFTYVRGDTLPLSFRHMGILVS